MQSRVHSAILASFVMASCAVRLPDTDPETEPALRARLQAEHDATLCLELRGRLDAAAASRGVREVKAWCDEWGFEATGSVDASGLLSIAVPTIQAHDRCLTIVHVVDRAGVHWYCWLDLTKAPPSGPHDVGELRLRREPETLFVADDRGRPLAGARVLIDQQCLEEHPGLSGRRPFDTCTDEHGRASLCRAAPFDASPRLIVRHEGFAPWWGPLAPRVELDHGGEIRGRVVLPGGVDPADFAVGVWVDEASPRRARGDSTYANVTAPLAPDGTYRLRNVPHGQRAVGVQERNDGYPRGCCAVQVGALPTTASDLTIDPLTRPNVAMRFRMTGHDGRAPLAPHATILVSDVGCRVPLRDGYVDWVGERGGAFAISVPGYGVTSWSTHRSGTTFRLRGGHRVSLRLAIDAARRLPAGCALRATVTAISDDTIDVDLGRDPVLHVDREWHLDDETPLGIARDALVVVDGPGRYGVELELLRWDAAEGEFVEVRVDVEPSEFEVRAGAASTLVTLSSRFVDAPL
jgi:hypothetical protein